jgi:hypothetical protein
VNTEKSNVLGKIKSVLLFIVDILPIISYILSGITLAGVMAILSGFLDFSTT